MTNFLKKYVQFLSLQENLELRYNVHPPPPPPPPTKCFDTEYRYSNLNPLPHNAAF